MTDFEPCRDTDASGPTIPGDAPRRHLRLIPSPSPSLSSDEDAHESPTQRTNHAVAPDDPPFSILAW